MIIDLVDECICDDMLSFPEGTLVSNGDNKSHYEDNADDEENDADIESDDGDDDSESMIQEGDRGILRLRGASVDSGLGRARGAYSPVLRLRGGFDNGGDSDGDSDNGLRAVVTGLEQQVLDLQQTISTLADNTPTRRRQLVRATYPFKVPQSRKVRTDDYNTTMRIVREEMCRLLGTGKDREFISVVNARPQLLADFDEVARFCSDDTAPGPTLENPQIYLNGPECIWNVHLARHFAQSVIEKYHNRNLDADVVARHFLNRIDTLRKSYIKWQPQGDENAEEARGRAEERFVEECQQKRRRRRQDQLYQVRLAACEENIEQEGWNLLFQMVSVLKIDGQSSDESDGDHQFRVRTQTWRNPQVSALLYHIDEHRPTTNHLGNRRPGAQPRYRHYSEETTSRHPEDIPARLPANMYSPTWLQSLVEPYQLRLNPQSIIDLPEIDYVPV